MKYSYRTSGVCNPQFDIEIENGKIVDLVVYGGCGGNLQGIIQLVKGMYCTDVISRLQGIRCGIKRTSCPDQLATALIKILQQHNG